MLRRKNVLFFFMGIFEGFNDLLLVCLNIFLGVRGEIGTNNIYLQWESIRRNRGRGTFHSQAVREALQNDHQIECDIFHDQQQTEHSQIVSCKHIISLPDQGLQSALQRSLKHDIQKSAALEHDVRWREEE
jgi:hypothetical protein